MTTEETELLISQWGTDPAPPVLADPWERQLDSFGQEGAVKATLRNRPDLEWAVAGRIADPGDLGQFSNGRNSGGSGPRRETDREALMRDIRTPTEPDPAIAAAWAETTMPRKPSPEGLAWSVVPSPPPFLTNSL